MKITDLKCAVLGQNPVVRITTDAGIDGYGEVENTKSYLRPHVLFYRSYLLDQDPTDVERVMLRIRRLGGFKPWGSAVSAIEMALWDIAGKAAGVPVYKLLGGKVRDTVRVYNGGVRFPMNGSSPQDYADNVARMKAAPEKFGIIKQGIGFHSDMPRRVPDFTFGEVLEGRMHVNRGLLTERGLKHVIACVEAMKSVMGDDIEKHAVHILGPDPADIGGLAELKWVAEYADLHGILMAPHGVFDGLIGLAGLVQVCATLPANFIAFEYPVARPEWWYDIIEGLPDPIVEDGRIRVWDTPGLGVRFNIEAARQYLVPGEEGFFD